ncbi:unnamed protein product [Tilletia controversa]|nr:unnamed protein product [Tilletia controversa]
MSSLPPPLKMTTTTTAAGAGDALSALYLYTHDVARQLKPSIDGELAHALHETLHFALDAQEQDWGTDSGDASAMPDCGGSAAAAAANATATAAASNSRVNVLKQHDVLSPRLADSQPSSSAASPLLRPVSASTLPGLLPELPQDLPPARTGFFPNPLWSRSGYTTPNRSGNASPTRASVNGAASSSSTSTSTVIPSSSSSSSSRRRPPYISYGWQPRTKTLSLPHPATISNPTTLDPCSPEARSAFDVTAKLFFLDDISSPSDTETESDARAREAQVHAQADKLATYVENALKRLSASTGIITVDTLLLSFPQANFDLSLGRGGSQGGQELQRALEERLQVVAELWRNLSPNPQLLSLGLSRFSLSSLQTLFHFLHGMPHPPGGPPPTTPSVSSSLVRSLSQAGNAGAGAGAGAIGQNDGARWPDVYSTPRDVRRPRLITVSLSNSSSSAGSTSASANGNGNGNGNGSVRGPQSQQQQQQQPAVAMAIPSTSGSHSGSSSVESAGRGRSSGTREDDEFTAITEWCEQEGIVPVADSDRKDVLPKRTLPTLLKEFRDALPHPVPEGHRLVPRWVMKYSVIIRDRGVLVDRGYILYAEVEPEPQVEAEA